MDLFDKFLNEELEKLKQLKPEYLSEKGKTRKDCFNEIKDKYSQFLKNKLK